MAIVTDQTKLGLSVSYWDGKGQTFPFRGFHVEGNVPYVPEDDAPGWVCFDLDEGTFQEQASYLAGKLFTDLGFTAEQVIFIMEDF